MVNIVGNIVGEFKIIELETKNGETFKMVNFFVIAKDDEENKIYINCSVYGEKGYIKRF